MIKQVANNNLTLKSQNFWRRQFTGNITTRQLVYDIMFGIVLPILCFIFDPIVFSGDGFINGLVPLAQFKLFVYLSASLSILTLAVWLLASRALKSSGGIIAGILLSGAICSFLIGILILPLSILGLVFVIGALGFTPFFTAFVYLRNGIRAMKIAESHIDHPRLVNGLLSGAFLVIALPYATHVGVNRAVAQSINELTSGDVRLIESGVKRLKYIGWYAVWTN